ncbi:alanine--tRNA ligase [Candidatus Woesebacteria bacterium]|nr:alanine--tRNA ligase [Candidatus Woesebacteria bacterium]
MKASEVREKYLQFFERRGHKRIAAAPLVLENDPTTLFTSSGMQPLIPYLMGEPHPEGKRLVDSQPSIRTQDIEEVGNTRHTTFFEMLGNWSLGDYFKAEQLPWIWEFLTEELKLPKEKLWISVFEGLPAQAGTKEIPKDTESYEIWKKLGVPENKIHFYGVDKNWWSRSGTPDQMPAGEIGGPTSEVFFEFTEVKHQPKFGKNCHPNCDCGRFLEIGNSVFMVYRKTNAGKLEELPQKNVDFGGGLERLTAVTNNNPDVFMIDLFRKMISDMEDMYGMSYETSSEVSRSMRIIADHLRASAALISAGVFPSNKLQGYVLRRLLRRAILHARFLRKGEFHKTSSLPMLGFPEEFGYPEGKLNQFEIQNVIDEEELRFRKTINKGLKEFDQYVTFGEVGKPETKKKILDPRTIFRLYDTYGFPYELSKEEGEKRGIQIPSREEFELELDKHKNLSRTQSAGVFKGGLADHSKEVTRLHTATHLLHAALRKILGDHVSQKGSNITAERLRFDFTHNEKLSDEEIKKVEELVNEQIEKKLPVSFEMMTLEKAMKKGALAFFGERYGEKVKVYSIGPSTLRRSADRSGLPFSMEVCGGPHVKNTDDVGRVKITKQEKVGTGMMRIYATNQ